MNMFVDSPSAKTGSSTSEKTKSSNLFVTGKSAIPIPKFNPPTSQPVNPATSPWQADKLQANPVYNALNTLSKVQPLAQKFISGDYPGAKLAGEIVMTGGTQGGTMLAQDAGDLIRLGKSLPGVIRSAPELVKSIPQILKSSGKTAEELFTKIIKPTAIKTESAVKTTPAQEVTIKKLTQPVAEEAKTMYHATTPENAKLIQQSGFKAKNGNIFFSEVHNKNYGQASIKIDTSKLNLLSKSSKDIIEYEKQFGEIGFNLPNAESQAFLKSKGYDGIEFTGLTSDKPEVIVTNGSKLNTLLKEQSSPLAEEARGVVTLYHASPNMPTKGNWKKGTYFANTPDEAMYYATSHHRGDVRVMPVSVPKDLVVKEGQYYRLKNEYPITQLPSESQLDLAKKASSPLEGAKTGQVTKTGDNLVSNGKEVSQTQDIKTTQATEGQGTQVQGGKAETTQTPLGQGETKTSTLGLRVEQTAIEKKLTSELADLPQYQQLNMKDQAKKATDLLNSDPERALRVALGQEASPEGLVPESVFKAMEASVTTPEMAQKLATSPLVSTGTALGQRIKALDVKISDSPVEAIRQVIDARAKVIENRTGRKINEVVKKTTEDIKSKVKTPDKYDWGAFLDSIKC